MLRWLDWDRRSLGTVRLSWSPSFIPYRERKHPQTAPDPRHIVDKALSETRAGRSQSERGVRADVVPSRRAITAQMRCTAHLFGNLQQPKLAIAAINMPDRIRRAAVSHWQCRCNYCGNSSAAKAASFIVLQAVTDSWLHADRDAFQPDCSTALPALIKHVIRRIVCIWARDRVFTHCQGAPSHIALQGRRALSGRSALRDLHRF